MGMRQKGEILFKIWNGNRDMAMRKYFHEV